MPDRVVLDVIDRPAGGLRRVVMDARATRASGPPGVRALLVLGTGRFVPRVVPAPTPRRMALLSAWEDGADVDPGWSSALGGLCRSATRALARRKRRRARGVHRNRGRGGCPTQAARARWQMTSPR